MRGASQAVGNASERPLRRASVSALFAPGGRSSPSAGWRGVKGQRKQAIVRREGVARARGVNYV